MAYNVEEIEGVGKTYGNRLAALGITTTDDLLEKGGTKAGRQKIAEATDIPESLVLTWVNHADLMRIDGVAGHYSELLEASGVDTVKELATRNAENLQSKMHEINTEYGLTKKVPSGELVKSMINQAKTLEQKVFH